MTQLKAERLRSHLERDELKSCYLICGDEPLQVIECADAVRAQARATGIEERLVMHVEAGFDWNSLTAAGDAMSLFASRRLLELRMPTGKPGKEGAKVLTHWAETAGDDDVLLITSARLDKRAQQAKWVKALLSRGVMVNCYEIARDRLPGWLSQRASAQGLELTVEAAQIIAERAEGNMLAAAQELDKLRLLADGERVDKELVRKVTADSARHDIFELADAALAGDSARVLRILRGLRSEGTTAQSVAWILGREIKVLTAVMSSMAQGNSEGQALSEQRVWDSRAPLVRAAIRRHKRHGLVRLTRLAAYMERTGKGMSAGEPWEECIRLAMALSGVRSPQTEASVLAAG